ncbi:Fc.00g076060.m01.CDS01 [Cosmosporella sp. VM-42]
MASFIAKFVTKKILGETMANKFGKEDPYFEHVPATRLDGTPNGKLKKRKKALPPGISQHDGQILTKVKRRAYRLDMALFSLCGIRFGWGSVIGLVPAIGDVIDALMALMVLKTCGKIEGGLPTAIKTKMLFNIILDFGIGLVPFIGDLADAVFRANTRNAAILEEYLREVGKKNLRANGQPIPAIDPSDPAEFDRMQSEQPPGYVSHPPSIHESTASRPQTGRSQRPMPAEPEPARTHQSRSFFGRSKSRPNDVEMGQVDANSRLQKQRRDRH